jgi:adenosylcobyric acid synthase
LLPVNTVFAGEKATYQDKARLTRPTAWLSALAGAEIEGYEIHMGRTDGRSAWLEITQRNGEPVRLPDGAMSTDGKVWGCYLHGLFANPEFRRAWLTGLGWRPEAAAGQAEEVSFNAAITYLADAVEQAVDMRLLEAIIREL